MLFGQQGQQGQQGMGATQAPQFGAGGGGGGLFGNPGQQGQQQTPYGAQPTQQTSLLSHGFGTQGQPQQGLPTFGQAGPQGDTRTDDQKDINMADPSHQPKDTVADIQFHPSQTYAFAVATWDGKVSMYNISNTGQGQSIGMLKQYDVGAPALRLAFSSSNSNWLYCASGDGAIKIIDLNSGAVQPFVQHPGIFWLDVYTANGIEV